MIQKSRGKGCYHTDIAEDVGCSVSIVKRALKRQGPPAKRKQGAGFHDFSLPVTAGQAGDLGLLQP